MTPDAAWLADMPAVYDATLGPVLFEPFAEELAERIVALAPGRVLELAAGTGRLTAALARRLPSADLTATDLNPGMVAYGAERIPSAHWGQADAQALPYPERSYDVVVSQFGVMFFPDKGLAFAETARVLTPSGRTIFAVWDSLESSVFTHAMVESLATAFPDDPPDFIGRVPHGYHDEARIRADLTAAGLVPESVERVVRLGRAPDARTLTRGYCLGTPLRFELEGRGDLAALTAGLAQEMTRRLGAGPLEARAAALVVSARVDPAG